MTLDTGSASAAILKVAADPFPAAGMRVGFAAGVTLDADIATGVAALAGLQISPGLAAVIHGPVCLSVLPQWAV